MAAGDIAHNAEHDFVDSVGDDQSRRFAPFSDLKAISAVRVNAQEPARTVRKLARKLCSTDFLASDLLEVSNGFV